MILSYQGDKELGKGRTEATGKKTDRHELAEA